MDYLFSLNQDFWDQLAQASLEPASLGVTLPHLALALLAVASGFLLTMLVRRVQHRPVDHELQRAGRQGRRALSRSHDH